jgi:hypothetical protein
MSQADERFVQASRYTYCTRPREWDGCYGEHVDQDSPIERAYERGRVRMSNPLVAGLFIALVMRFYIMGRICHFEPLGLSCLA